MRPSTRDSIADSPRLESSFKRAMKPRSCRDCELHHHMQRGLRVIRGPLSEELLLPKAWLRVIRRAEGAKPMRICTPDSSEPELSSEKLEVMGGRVSECSRVCVRIPRIDSRRLRRTWCEEGLGVEIVAVSCCDRKAQALDDRLSRLKILLS